MAEGFHDDLRMVQVITGSRLHFGMFDVRSPYGGVGMMIDQPRTAVRVISADEFGVDDEHRERLSAIAKRIAPLLTPDQLSGELPRCQLSVETDAAAHCGLGAGTQLSLAAAVAITRFFGLTLTPGQLVNEIATRGKRSLVGSLGFFHGGLINESGDDQSMDSHDSWKRTTLPDSWHVVTARPTSGTVAISGEAEGAAFAALRPASDQQRRDLAFLGDRILRACAMGEFHPFCTAVSKFNRLSGELFSMLQGGCYNGQSVTQLVTRMQDLGLEGVGQSSWGPTVFGFCQSVEDAIAACDELNDVAPQIARPLRTGYSIESF